MLKSIAIAAALVLAGGGAAVAQSNPTGTALVEALFANLEADVVKGLPVISNSRGILPKETTADHTFNAVSGHTYAVVGVCDEGCSDLDLGVYAGDGSVMGSDVEEDDTPVVVFEATETGRHQITVLMAVCGSRCNYGVRVYDATQ
ncbi:MAG TPA: hypothetical protein VGE54_05375 [Brevundimonas sp.]